MTDPEREALTATAEEQTKTSTSGQATQVLERIGPYRLLEVLGEGGMGVVYLAEQVEPVARRVALKIIKLGMETKEVVARFEAERQALALMDHPSIARVFDAGATESGRPYFVMELVRGLPLTDYCDRERLTTEERLRLFIQTCQAVNHAHQKGVIHRDLKPNNVLVTIQDGQPAPKIIDFGIAKALHRRLTDQTLVTHMGEIMGTPAFMSPEQLEGGSLDVDTRADIYSLGVTLYLLLSGHLPFEAAEIKQAAGVASHLREHDPPLPSARITTAKSPKELAESRRTDIGHLRRALRGDLDWIVLKAMARERASRYETANGLALDLERHMRNEPVSARPPTAAYRTRKFVRRHRVGVAFGAVLLGMLLGFAVAVGLQARRVAHERDRAEAEAAKAAAVARFLQETLGAADPWESGRDQSVREVLRGAADKVEASFKDQPLVAAAVRRTIGQAYFGLGRFKESEALLRSALEIRTAELGPDRQEVAESLGDLSRLLGRLSRFDESVALARRAVAIQRKTEAANPLGLAVALRALGTALYLKGDYAESAQVLREALALQTARLPAADLERATILIDLASALGSGLQDGPAAEKLLREALEIRRAKLGRDHPETARALNDLAVTRLIQEDYQEAEVLYKEALEADERSLGREHPETASTLENLGGVYYRTKRYDEALAALAQVLAARKKGLGDDSLEVARTMHNIAVVQTNAGRYREAEASFQQALPRMKAAQGPDHPEVAQALASWAKLKKDQKDYVSAERLYRESLDLHLRKAGEESSPVAKARLSLAQVLVLEGRFAEAEALVIKVLETREKTLGKDAELTRAASEELRKLHEAWGRPEKAAR